MTAEGRAVVVDAHHHLWPDPDPVDYPWMTDELAAIRRPFQPADLGPLLEGAGVDRTVLVQTRAALDETMVFLATAAATPFIAGVVGWVDLTAPSIADDLGRLRAAPGGERLVAIRHQVHDEPDPDWLRRPDVRRGIAAVGDAGLACDLLVRTRELPAAVDTARALPELRFVLDHLAKPPIAAGGPALAAWTDAIRPLGELPNVVAKVSGLVTEADWTGWTVEDLVVPARTALETFGPDRLLFGSDWPVCLVAAPYWAVADAAREALTGAGLPAAEQADVFGANAIAAYQLRV
ncbi:MAG TPA: amidohydrolase family protein [Candidatus Limnocylindrales bacterium]